MAERTCSIEGCERKHYGIGYCRRHWHTFRKYGDPLFKPEPLSGPAHPQWIGDSITYEGAHRRVQRRKGSASLHDCVDCGGRATDWSCVRFPLTSPEGLGYSPDVEDYEPRCQSCHSLLDGIGDKVWQARRKADKSVPTPVS